MRLLAVQLCFPAAGAGAALFAVGAALLGRTAPAGAAFFAVLLPHGLLLPLPVQHGVLLLLLLLAQLCLLLLLLLHVQHYCVLLLLFAQLWLLVSDKRQRKTECLGKFAGAVLFGAAASMARLLVQYCLPLLLLVQHCLLQELSASFAFACVCSCGIRSPSAAVSVVALHCCWRLSPLSARAAAVQRQLGRIAFACE